MTDVGWEQCWKEDSIPFDRCSRALTIEEQVTWHIAR